MQIAGMDFSDALAALGRSFTTEDRIASYLIGCTVVLSAVVTYWQTRHAGGFRGFIRHCMPPGTLSHPSAKADVLFWLSRHLFVPFLVIPLSISTVTAGYAAYSLLSLLFGPAVHVGP